METIDSSSHEKDSGIGRTDESTKNEDSSDGLECLESHSFGDYYNYQHHQHQQPHQHHRQQQHQQQQQQQQTHHHHHQQQQQLQLLESESTDCSALCRHKNLSPVKDPKGDRKFFDRTASVSRGFDPRPGGDSDFYGDKNPPPAAVRNREKNWRDKLERLEKMRCHYECRLLQLELMRIGRSGLSSLPGSCESRVLDVNRNPISLRLSASDVNSNVKALGGGADNSGGGMASEPMSSAQYRLSQNSLAVAKHRSRSSEVDYCARNLSARAVPHGQKQKPAGPRTATACARLYHYLEPQRVTAPSGGNIAQTKASGRTSPTRRTVPKMGVRCLEESLLQTLHQAAPRFLESSPIGRGNRSRFQDAAESSVRPSRSFLGTEEVGNGGRFLYPGIAAISGSGSGSAGGRCSNASKFVGSACRNENFISSPARYKVENGRIYRLPLATKDVPKSEQLANCFQAFMPLASTFLLRNGSRRERPAQSLVNQPLGHHNQHYNRPQHQHHRHHLHLPRDTNNNSDGSSSCSNSNNGGINAGICGDERGLHRRPWFGSLTHVDSGGRHGRVIPTETSTAPFVHSPYIGRRPESIQSPEHPVVRQEARSTRVWECLKEDARVSVAEDDFDNYVEWLTLSRAQCFYGNLPKAGQQRKTEPPATKQVYHHHNNSSNINNIHNNHYHHHHHNHHQWQSHRHHHQHRNDTQHHRNHQRYDNPRPIDASGRRSSCSNPTNSDFEGRHLPPRREFSLLRDSDESDNDYVDIDALDLTLSRAIDDDDPRNQRQQAATASDDFKRAKESNRHAGRKSLRKKQLLRERARKLAEERNSRNSGRQDPSAIPSSKCKTQTSRKNVDKRRSRQKLMIPTDAKAHESAIHFSAGQEGEEEEEECGFLESSQTENFYSSLAGYESTEGSFVHERALAEMNSRGEDSVLFVRAKHQPSMTSV